MARGSKPGERRGGRKRGTPNKKTALKNAACLAAAASPDSSPLEFMLRLMRDRQVPLDDRIDMAIASAPYVHARARSSASRQTNPLDIRNAIYESGDLTFRRMDAKLSQQGDDPPGLSPLEFLTSVIRDEAANPQQRVKAAKAAARYKHMHVRPEELPVLVEDKFGFSPDPMVAREIRDIQRRGLVYHSTGRPPEMQGEIARSLARVRQLRRTLKPPGGGYDIAQKRRDEDRLWQFWGMRNYREKLSPEQDAEEAHLMARVQAYQPSEAARQEHERMVDEHEKKFPSSKIAACADNKPTVESNNVPLQPDKPATETNDISQKAEGQLFEDNGFQEYLD